MKRIRVLHCPGIVGGNPSGLAHAERELGLNSWAVAFRQNVFSYPIDEILLKSPDHRIANMAARLSLLWRALTDYDVIHYNFGQTIFPSRFQMVEMQLLKYAGKYIAVTFQGDDARQGDYCLRNFDISIAHFVEPGYYSPESDADKRRVIRAFDRHAHLLYYLNPDLGYVLPDRARFMPYAHIDLREWKEIPPATNTRPLVVHAPSHRGVKGTRFILEAIEHLKSDGLEFDFLLIEGIPNNEARKLYESADLLIDQLFAGWYGGLATEFMALGKPVISYIRQSDLKFIPEKMRQELPVIDATSETIYDVLKYWLNDKDGLLEIGKRSRLYVENWHNPLTIAAQLRNDYMSVMAS
jgi:glycosyltransferase involved in cell wall biosynthesis